MEANQGLRTFDGATAIITGGASGIGRALAEALAGRGCDVVIADLQIELAQSVATQITDSGAKASAEKVDVSDSAAMQRLVRETHDRSGRLDYLFNNAGISIGGDISQYAMEDWNRIFKVNLRGVVNGIHAAYPIMLAQRFGHIVNTASLSGLIPFPAAVAYATTKHAVVGLSKSLRAAAALMGIRVTVLCPGFIHTAILQNGGKYGKTYFTLPPATAERLLAKLNPMPPETFAQKALQAIAKNKAIVVGRADWQLAWRLHCLLPVGGITLAQKLYKKTLIQLGFWPKG